MGQENKTFQDQFLTAMISNLKTSCCSEYNIYTILTFKVGIMLEQWRRNKSDAICNQKPIYHMNQCFQCH